MTLGNTPLSLENARLLAERHVAAMKLSAEDLELALMTNETIERDYGWIFFYQSKDWIERGDFSAMLAGNAPFLVEKESGRIVEFGTALPVEEYLMKYEEGLCSG